MCTSVDTHTENDIPFLKDSDKDSLYTSLIRKKGEKGRERGGREIREKELYKNNKGERIRKRS